MATAGYFISLEGLEGVGKTTNREFIEQYLTDAGMEVVVTREPGGTELGEQLRSLLLHTNATVSAETELMMMAASRKQHVDTLIAPALASGKWVLCDRFADASFAYQGGGRELGLDVVDELHQLMNITLKPEMTFLLDMPVADGMARMNERGEPDRIEKETLTFFDRARDAYLALASKHPERIKIIDAAQSINNVQAQIAVHLEQLVRRFHG